MHVSDGGPATDELATKIDERVIAAVEQVIRGGVSITARALDGEVEDLTFSQWRVLMILGEQPADAHVRGVGELVGVSAPSASRLLRRLEDRGLIELQRDPRDRRFMRVHLTTTGHGVRDQVIERRRILIREALATSDGHLPSDLPDAMGAIGEALIRRG